MECRLLTAQGLAIALLALLKADTVSTQRDCGWPCLHAKMKRTLIFDVKDRSSCPWTISESGEAELHTFILDNGKNCIDLNRSTPASPQLQRGKCQPVRCPEGRIVGFTCTQSRGLCNVIPCSASGPVG